jgi:hypothetical protein
VPAAPFLRHLLFPLQPRHHAVQIVRAGPHLCSQLFDRDPRLALDGCDSLGGACAAPFPPSTTTFAGRPACLLGPAGFRCASCRSLGRGCAPGRKPGAAAARRSARLARRPGTYCI